MEIQIPMDLHKFLPSPDGSVGGVPGYGAKGPRFKSRVLLIVITNDFIIFEFSLLKLKFQEVDLNLPSPDSSVDRASDCRSVEPWTQPDIFYVKLDNRKSDRLENI